MPGIRTIIGEDFNAKIGRVGEKCCRYKRERIGKWKTIEGPKS